MEEASSGSQTLWKTSCGRRKVEDELWKTLVLMEEASYGSQTLWKTSCGRRAVEDELWKTEGGRRVVKESGRS